MNVALIAGATAVGALAGWLIACNLATLSHRRPGERDLPAPRWHRWLPALTAAGAVLVATSDARERLLLAAPILTVGVYLAAVDADVERLPFKHVLFLGLLEAVAVAVVAIATQNPLAPLNGAAGALVAYLGFRVIHHLANGHLGYGDVTLTVPLALATTAVGGPALGWLWIVISLAAAALYALLRTSPARTHRPLGPWLIFGAVVVLAMLV